MKLAAWMRQRNVGLEASKFCIENEICYARNSVGPVHGGCATGNHVHSTHQGLRQKRNVYVADRSGGNNPYAVGDTRSAFMMTEPALEGGAGSDPSMMQTTAMRQGDHWIINGRKTLITGAVGAKIGILMAKSQTGPCMFVFEMPCPGIRVERVLDTIDNSLPGGHAEIAIENLALKHHQVLGEIGQGFQYAQIRLAPARLSHCMRWHGACVRANEIAANYACRRSAFGKPLVDHEGIGFMLADNLIDLQQSELMIDWCADVIDSGAAANLESSMTKVAVSEALFRIADRCVQVLGGLGVTRDTIVEQVFREIRAFRIYDGPTEVHKWSIAKSIKREHRVSEEDTLLTSGTQQGTTR